jgi:hypothetical protein
VTLTCRRYRTFPHRSNVSLFVFSGTFQRNLHDRMASVSTGSFSKSLNPLHYLYPQLAAASASSSGSAAPSTPPSTVTSSQPPFSSFSSVVTPVPHHGPTTSATTPPARHDPSQLLWNAIPPLDPHAIEPVKRRSLLSAITSDVPNILWTAAKGMVWAGVTAALENIVDEHVCAPEQRLVKDGMFAMDEYLAELMYSWIRAVKPPAQDMDVREVLNLMNGILVIEYEIKHGKLTADAGTIEILEAIILSVHSKLSSLHVRYIPVSTTIEAHESSSLIDQIIYQLMAHYIRIVKLGLIEIPTLSLVESSVKANPQFYACERFRTDTSEVKDPNQLCLVCQLPYRAHQISAAPPSTTAPTSTSTASAAGFTSPSSTSTSTSASGSTQTSNRF